MASYNFKYILSEECLDQNVDIMVSVAMLTYNHEKYIKQAIESVLMQKVNFRYELVIAEDCSTDKTRDIILEYKEKYPEIIKLILHDVNIGMIKNEYDLRTKCKGKYIASLEGDDYWTDDKKLQKQVDFLEKNHNYSAVYHNVATVNRFGKPIKSVYPYRKEHTIHSIQYMNNLLLIGQTASLVYRNFWLSFSVEEEKLFNNCKCVIDRKLSLELLFQGKVYYMSDVMANYRYIVKGGDSWTAKMYGKNTKKIAFNMKKSLIEYAYLRKKIEINSNILRMVFMEAVTIAIENPNSENIKIAIEILYDYLLYIFVKKLKKSFYR